jgi:hypothetical protein
MKIWYAFTLDARFRDEYGDHPEDNPEVWETSEARLRAALATASKSAFEDGRIAEAEAMAGADPDVLVGMRAALAAPAEWTVRHYDLGKVTAALVVRTLRREAYVQATLVECTMRVYPNGRVRRADEEQDES